MLCGKHMFAGKAGFPRLRRPQQQQQQQQVEARNVDFQSAWGLGARNVDFQSAWGLGARNVDFENELLMKQTFFENEASNEANT